MKITPDRRIDYKDWVIYEGKEYVRTETLSLKNYHTIKWSEYKVDGNIEYYSLGMGWMDADNKLHKDNPMPDIEKVFNKTVGRDLIYFENNKLEVI